jgi:RNA polymerase sigma factor (TIGR02999 family)
VLPSEQDTLISNVLDAAARGDPKASEDLLPLVYGQLHALAQARMRQEAAGNTLQATALVHEAYLRIAGDRTSWGDRRHFFAAAALAMRRILVERARQRKGPKRGGGIGRVTMDSAAEFQTRPGTPEADWESLDRALNELEVQDPDLVRIVHLRYFAGLSIDETALAMERSARSIDRDWKCARAWLLERLSREDP